MREARLLTTGPEPPHGGQEMHDGLMVSVSGVRGRVGEGLTPEVVASFAAAFSTTCSTLNALKSLRSQTRVASGHSLADHSNVDT